MGYRLLLPCSGVMGVVLPTISAQGRTMRAKGWSPGFSPRALWCVLAEWVAWPLGRTCGPAGGWSLVLGGLGRAPASAAGEAGQDDPGGHHASGDGGRLGERGGRLGVALLGALPGLLCLLGQPAGLLSQSAGAGRGLLT